jgi:predicted transcriptional regulator YheO
LQIASENDNIQNELKPDEIAAQLDISKTTLYKYLRVRNVKIGQHP